MADDTDEPRDGQAFLIANNGKAVEVDLRPQGGSGIITDKDGKQWIIVGKLPNKTYLLKPVDESSEA